MCRRPTIPFGICLLALGLSGCFDANATGRYVAQFTNGVYRLQLVQAQDGHLSGQLDTVVLNQGKPEYSSFVASGVSDGGSISLTFKQSAFLSMTLAGSGTVSGNKISLTGDVNPGKLSTVTFVRANDAEYQSDVNNLILQANNAAAAKTAFEAAQREGAKRKLFANTIEQLVAQIQHFDTAADGHIATWSGAEASYRAITDKMNVYLNRERSLAGTDTASVERGQIAVAISQASIGTDQLHNDAIAIQDDFNFNIVPLMKTTALGLDKCRTVVPAPENREIKTACDRLTEDARSFQQKYNLYRQGLLRLENIYQEERKKQGQLVQASERLE